LSPRLQYGEIASFPVGYVCVDREHLCNTGLHATRWKGIQGNTKDGARSVVLSGGYEDDDDLGEEFTYTGSGGQKAWGWGSDMPQVEDQVWARENMALLMSYQLRKPVRVIRGSNLRSAFAPRQGYRYDGLYMVVECDRKPGKSKFLVCLFRFVRCPGQLPLPAPVQGSNPFTRLNTMTRSRPSPPSLGSELTSPERDQRRMIVDSDPESDPESDLDSDILRPMFMEGSSTRPIYVF